MNKYIAIVIAIVLAFLGLIMAYTMGPGDAPGGAVPQVNSGKAH
ncbi:MAG: hypothetical protein NT083_10160 [Rhodocyclales bacterium]|nr:hypothetical protein [Rhodocyclales bacterium]